MRMDPEKLVEEIVKLMYCLKAFEKKKEREMEEFREKEKKRYEFFLNHIRSMKK